MGCYWKEEFEEEGRITIISIKLCVILNVEEQRRILFSADCVTYFEGEEDGEPGEHSW